MVDTIIVGRTLGVGALAGVGATGSILFLILGFVIGMATGFSIICAQRFGARDRLGLRRSFLASLILCALIAVVMTAGGVAAARPILVLMNTPADILGDAVSYLEITMWGVGVTLLFNILSSTITALGDSRSPLFFLIIACTLNIFLDLLFILSFGMGVGGAALATVLSQGISALLCAGFIVSKYRGSTSQAGTSATSAGLSTGAFSVPACPWASRLPSSPSVSSSSRRP